MWVRREDMVEIWMPHFSGSDDMIISKAQMHICPSGVTLIKAFSQMMRVYQNEILWTSEINMNWSLYLGCLV